MSDWVVNGSTIDAPHNFAFDGAGGIVSVNGSFFEPGRVVTDTGDQYDGSTPRLTVQTPVTPGPHVLYLSIFDAGDGVLDSGAFVDRLQAGAAGPAGCSAGANEPPVAVDDALTTAEDTPSAPLNVLANDSDPDGHALTVTTLAPSAAHGTVSCTAAGMCTYTPAANYNGPDSFTYAVSDGHGGTDTATVSVTVTSVNDNPDAVNDSLTTVAGHAGQVNVLANDTDVDGDSLSVTTLTPTRRARDGLLLGRGRVHVHAERGLLRAGLVQLLDLGRPRRHGHGDRLGHGHRGQPPARRRRRRDRHARGHGRRHRRARRRHRRRRRHADGDDAQPERRARERHLHRGRHLHRTRRTRTTTGPTRSPTRSPTATAGPTPATVTVTVTPVNDQPNAVDDTLTTAEDTASAPLNVLANDTDVDGDTLS